MPISIITYFGAVAAQNKNLLERMNFVKRFFVLRIVTLGMLGWYETISNRHVNYKLEKDDLLSTIF
tara:strand:+ start:500 stop:697 length:198 start_codon:yes stop_codon:yes gene_type:complete